MFVLSQLESFQPLDQLTEYNKTSDFKSAAFFKEQQEEKQWKDYKLKQQDF